MPTCAAESKVTAFVQGLREGDFVRSLVKNSPRDIEELLSRVEKYVNMEEAQRHKREVLRKDRGERSGNPEERGRKEHHLRCFSRYTSLKSSEDKSVHVCKREEKEILKSAQPFSGHPLPLKFCEYHRNCYHDTSQCRMLKRVFSQSNSLKAVANPSKKVWALPWAPKPSALINHYRQKAGQMGHHGDSSRGRAYNNHNRGEPPRSP